MKPEPQWNLPFLKDTTMNDYLAELESSESIYFHQKFTQSSAQLELPMRFVQEHGYKIDKWVILRTWTTSGTSARPWVVQLKIFKNPDGSQGVRSVDGWEAFATHCELIEGDSLIFLLSRQGVRSEFEVYVFREIGGSLPLLDLRDNSSDEEDVITDPEIDTKPSVPDSENKILPSPCLSNPEDETMKTTAGSSSQVQASELQLTAYVENRQEIPSFHKRLTASSIQRSNGIPNSGQFEFPGTFARKYGQHFQSHIQLQGVYEESPIYLVKCRGSRGRNARQNEHVRLGLRDHDWSAFVKRNGLKVGHKLKFSLVANSYFVVRKV